MAMPLVAAAPWWLVVALATAVLAVTVAVYLPFTQRGKSRKQAEAEAGHQRNPQDSDQAAPADDDRALDEEPWVPKFEIRPWGEASQLPGCPWSLDSCGGARDALERIWRPPLHRDLQQAFETLAERVKNVQVARMSQNGAVHFAIVYTLRNGAEIFGGGPVDHAVGLELGGEDDEGGAAEPSPFSAGLRQRRGEGSLQPGRAEEESTVPFPSLLPFYCVHDGFGVLLSVKHLPLLLGSPEDAVHASCFYVYPLRALERAHRRDHLVKFARVDKNCVACLDLRRQGRRVVYLEKSGEVVDDDDEHPMAFVGDTVRNLCGERVVPAAYMGGPSSGPLR